jgi:uncharacterized membrane protein YdbT with pleckstrin-like domain
MSTTTVDWSSAGVASLPVTSSTCADNQDIPASPLRLLALGTACSQDGAVTGIPKRLLGDDEEVVMALRPHWKELVGPVLVLLITSPVATYVVTLLDGNGAQGWLRWVVVAVAAVIVLRWAVWPFLVWLTTSYVVTDRRLIIRTGVVARRGRDMPLSRVNDVTFEHSGLLERVLRCGTLVVESAGERGQLVLKDVPHVEDVQRDVYQLAEADEERRRGDRDDGAARHDDDHRGW